MPVSSKLGTLTTLQSAQAGAANGTSLDISEAVSLLVEITGTYTGLTANFEASLDGGTTWNSVALLQLSSTSLARATGATANGLYLLENIRGMTAFRARTTASNPTGSMTVKAIGSLS